jgi:aryl-alcohol dehydrogenase-like predicted oxidoreductase
MQYKKLGRTGLKVSPFCLGTMVYGEQVGEAESIKLIKTAIAAGVNFIDTADGYGEKKGEVLVGKAIKEDRHSVVLATKICARVGPGPNDIGLSRKHIMQGIDESLKRLGTDYIDLYNCHFPDFDTPLEETLRAFDDIVHQGKVRYIGCSNFSAMMLMKSLWISDVRNLARFDNIQPPYNLLVRDIETELLPLCASEGIGVCVYNPLAGELLTEKHKFGKPPAEGRFTHPYLGKGYYDRYWSETNFKAADRIKKLAKERGCTLPQFSLAWILQNPVITAFLTGPTTQAQLKENLAAVEMKLTPEEMQACDEVWEMFRAPRYPYARDLQVAFTKKITQATGSGGSQILKTGPG